MPGLAQVREVFSRWIDVIALFINGQLERIESQRQLQLVEESLDQFRLHATVPDRKLDLPDHVVRISAGVVADPLSENWTRALRGSRIEILMRSSRFLFQPLELPKRAAEFLNGIVRTQIDRLTPWAPGEAAFSWTAPTDIPNDRIVLTVAATAKSMIEPYLRAVVDLGATTVVVATTPPGDDPAAATHMTMLEHKAGGVIDLRRIRQILIGVLLASGLATAASLATSAVLTDGLDAEQQQLQQAIAKRRAATRLGPAGAAASGQNALERRKQTTPSSVIVIEALSALLPDHTYITELRIEGDKVQVVGVTHDAPSLIQLIEQSPQFSRATFFAPTTRSLEDPGERFHIEAHIKPNFS